jgi:NAD(P)-dependent dehydrogenase (short-subunit alcohol dehydrogenase family)
VINYLSDDSSAERTAHEVRARGGRVALCQADVACREHRDLLVEHTLETFGRLDLLVNNAGIAPDVRRDLLEVTPESFDRVMDVNLKGAFFLAQRVARVMIAQRRSGLESPMQIVNISSIRAYTVNLTGAEYCISKAGLSMVTKLLAVRLAEHGISVYEIRPALIETDMAIPVKHHYDRLIEQGVMPIARWGQPDDIARAVGCIARGDLPFSTGETIDVDGGFHVRRI